MSLEEPVNKIIVSKKMELTSFQASDVLQNSLQILDSIRWENDLSSNITEVIINELENSIRLLYLSINLLITFIIENDPICILHLVQKYEKAMQKIKTNGNLSISPKMSESFLSKIPSGIFFATKKILLLFYCIAQFRNNKAISFNVLYLCIADIIRRKYSIQFEKEELITILLNNFYSGIFYKKFHLF